MSIFSKYEIISFFLCIALMLSVGKIMGEIFRRFKMPAVVGEILAGIVIGKTVLGRFAPDFYNWFFPTATNGYVSLDALALLGVTFLLLIAGMELDFSSVLNQGKPVLVMSAFNIMIPFAAGFSFAWLFPGFLGYGDTNIILSLFIAVAISITALPVIARILMDMDLFQTDFGMIVLTSALINDLTGWLIFSVVLQLMSTGLINPETILRTIAMTIVFSILTLTAFRWLVNRAIPWIQGNTEWPGGIISFIVITGLIFSAVTETIGIHAIFGAFMAGIAIGDSPHLRKHSREIIHQFISNIFAPLFFVSIGLRIDFFDHFNPFLTLVVFGIAVTTKVIGSLIGGAFTRMRIGDSLPVGFAMSARGAMEIILGLIGLQYKIINEELFVAIVIMAILTSLLAAPLMNIFLKMRKETGHANYIDPTMFVGELKAKTAEEAIDELAAVVAEGSGLEYELVSSQVRKREGIMSTGIGNGIAVPHARMKNIARPVVAVGKSREGIDFNSPDGRPATIVFMILTPGENNDSQIQILAEISRLFMREDISDRVRRAGSFDELHSLIKNAGKTA